MTKRKSANNTPENKLNNEIESSQIVDNEKFVQTFAKNLVNAISNPIFFNPYIQNEILKDINMHPQRITRDRVEELLNNPRQNEKALKDLSQYLEQSIMQFKRLIDYFSKMLVFDYTIEPTNADAEDMKSKPFKKSWNKACDFLDNLELKKTFIEVMRGVITEDAKFYYVRESDYGIRLQELPTEYCKIDYKNELGYQFSFDMTYFIRPGVNLSDFPPEFTDYYNNFLNYKDTKIISSNAKAEQHNSRYFYWQQLDPNKAVCFKFDPTRAGILVPMMGLFIDASEIDTYRRLIKTKTQLETWKLLINKIPLHKDNKTGNAKNDFALTADLAAQFVQIMSASMPEGVKPIAVPFEETQVVDFDQAQNKNNITGIGNEMFWESSGATRGLFGGNNLNGSLVKSSNRVDVSFVEHMYSQFEIFINNQLKLRTGRYRFRIHFEGTIFDEDERFEKALKSAQSGIITDKLSASLHMSPRQFDNMINLMQSRGYPDKLKPLLTSYTATGNEGGRTEKSVDNLSDGGMKTRDLEANIDR